MAISNAIGSNINSNVFGTGLPWVLKLATNIISLHTFAPITVYSEGMYSTWYYFGFREVSDW